MGLRVVEIAGRVACRHDGVHGFAAGPYLTLRSEYLAAVAW